jgi:hypothetical protein
MAENFSEQPRLGRTNTSVSASSKKEKDFADELAIPVEDYSSDDHSDVKIIEKAEDVAVEVNLGAIRQAWCETYTGYLDHLNCRRP